MLREALTMIGIGVIAGCGAAIEADRLLRHNVAGVQGYEPAALVFMAVTLTAAGLLASFVPARRASRIDPMKALRTE